ncbi:DUF3466 family protein [Acidisarcina polymorpha]|nr:DUF3466 family protein [Acidisarcina polymorpha]
MFSTTHFTRTIMRSTCVVLWSLGASSALTHCLGQSAPPRYKVLDLGPSLVRTLVDTPGLNARGDVALWRSTNGNDIQAFLLQTTHAVEIPGLRDFPLVFPADISNDETVVGLVQASGDMRFTRAFRWKPGQHPEILPPLNGKASDATANNAAGEIVGEAQVSGGAYHAVLWHNRTPVDLGVLAAGDYSKARDINNRSTVVGEANTTPNGKLHAFVWEKASSKMRQLPDPPGSTFCSAQAINDSGEVIGSCDLAHGIAHGVLWRDEKVVDLGSVGEDADDSVSTALDINIHTQIVGSSEIADGKQRAFLWEHGTLQNLNEMIPPHSGWLLLVASRINDAGEILGRGYYRDGIHSFLLLPQVSSAALRATSLAPKE